MFVTKQFWANIAKITILRTPIVPKIVQLQTFFKISSFVFSVNKEMYTGTKPCLLLLTITNLYLIQKVSQVTVTDQESPFWLKKGPWTVDYVYQGSRRNPALGFLPAILLNWGDKSRSHNHISVHIEMLYN